MKPIFKSVAAYGAAAAICLLLLTWILRLDKANLGIPLASGVDDAPLGEAWVKAVVENGWYLHNRHLGAPFGQDMHDFPLDEGLHFGIMKLLSLAGADWATVYNLYYLLGFPLTTITALFAFRRFGIAYGPGLVGAVLFAFLPYHFMRGEGHLFLSSYYLIPLQVLVIFWLYLDRGLFFRWDEASQAPRRELLNRATLGAALVCLLTASSGVYYAFFSCAFLGLAGAACAYRRRRGYPLATAATLIGLICLGVVGNLAPTFWYTHRHGPNLEAVHRLPLEAEMYGLRVIQLLLPIPGHRLPPLARLAARYATKGCQCYNENSFACLGTVGSLGFLYLAGRLFLCRRTEGTRLLDALTSFNLAAVLLGTVGGFGAVFSLLISPSIRGYNRISVFIGFFSLFAVVALLNRVKPHLRTPRAQLLYYGLLGTLVIGGTYDQFLRHVRPQYAALRQQFSTDAEFVGRIEAALPEGASVFQLPVARFPEEPPKLKMTGYDHLRGYLHSHHLRWSYGSMKGRPGDQWYRAVGSQPPAEMIDQLLRSGFEGIYVDRAGYEDHASALEADLTELLGAAPEESLDGRLAFFNMTAYTARVH